MNSSSLMHGSVHYRRHLMHESTLQMDLPSSAPTLSTQQSRVVLELAVWGDSHPPLTATILSHHRPSRRRSYSRHRSRTSPPQLPAAKKASLTRRVKRSSGMIETSLAPQLLHRVVNLSLVVGSRRKETFGYCHGLYSTVIMSTF